MLNSRKPVDYATMLPENISVVFFGEMSHNTHAYKTEILNALPELKRIGFTHLALEMFPKNLQDELNAFFAKGEKAKELKNFLSEYWAWGGDQTANLYFKIIDNARILGLKIVGLDMPYDEHQQFDTCPVSTLSQPCKQSSHLARNHVMAEMIQGIVKKGGRCIAFMHYLHAVKRGEFETGVQTLLNQKGITNKTIKLLHPEVQKGDQAYCMKNDNGDYPTIEEAFEKGIQKEKFYIQGKLSSWSRGEDYIVYLPCK